MSHIPFDIGRIRAQFPALHQQVNDHELVYLDNAATTQKPESVLDALGNYYKASNANVHRASHALSAQATAAFESARHDLARYINAYSEEELIWTRGATEAINLVANSWGNNNLAEGDEILLSTMEHHANIVPWQMLAQRTGAVIKVIPLQENGDLDMDGYRSLLTEKTRLVAVTHVSNALGTINPVAGICQLAKEAGAHVLIDGAQAMAHLQVDVQALDCDFYVFSGHKMYGPTGIGALWGKRELLEAMPPWQGGGEMIRTVSFEQTTYNELPFKFEAGTPNIAGAISLAEATRFISQFEHNALRRHEQQLLSHMTRGLKQVPGIRLVGEPMLRSGSVSFLLDGEHPTDVGMLLDMQGIAVRCGHHCAQPLMHTLGVPGTIRASVACYNTLEEVEFFLAALEKVKEML